MVLFFGAPASDLAALPLTPLVIRAFTATTAVGSGNATLTAALRERRSGLVPNDGRETGGQPVLDTWIGRVADLDRVALPAADAALDCRQHRLAWLGLQADGFLAAARAAVAVHGPSRVAVLLGTSTSTIAASEAAYREQRASGVAPATFERSDLHHLHATADLVRRWLGARGPAMTVSTACASSAKVFAQAARLIDVGVVDAAVVGGVDSLAASTLFGFNALGLVSTSRCRPFDRDRNGISIGEAAAFAVVARHDPARRVDGPLLIGYGESSDAHHLSAPHPEGRGAREAVVATLERAGIAAEAVDYLNLHGTATPKNDAVEAAVVASLYPPSTHASATKGWTGHTLGAAGAVEAVVCLLALRDGFAPGTLGCERRDAVCGPQIRSDAETRPLGIAMSHAFAFGGSNAVLAFARDAAAWHAARS